MSLLILWFLRISFNVSISEMGKKNSMNFQSEVKKLYISPEKILHISIYEFTPARI